ncbi:TIGR00159 family protein [bacterium J17]|nr:TIGR00159 family protein [bacterium J17]
MGVIETLDWSYLYRLLDVLLVSFLIYKTLLLVRGTRAEPMLVGLAIVVVVYILSRFLGLLTLNWLLGNFLGSVILVIVVLFQDDLRRALIKVGLMPGFGHQTYEVLENSISEVSKAAAELASRRIGALIVITRDVGLEDYTEHAVKLDALVSRQLLTSIFLPTSPIHDGAVVIAGQRLVAAGAVLPLTFNPDISSSYGTRHRAAIGLSERTDAVIVVVSEETGTVSLIREGKISKDLNEKTLYNALHRLTVF